MKKTPPSTIYDRDCFDVGSEDPIIKRLRQLRHELALDYLNPTVDEMILDIGCGRGEIVSACLTAGSNTIGIDYSQAAVDISRETVGDGVIVRASAVCLPFSDKVFDKVAVLDVIEHLDKHDAARCISEVRRVLKPSGMLILHTPNKYEKLISLPRRLHDLLFVRQKVSVSTRRYIGLGHVNIQSPISLKRMVGREGFKSRVLFKVPEADTAALWKRIVYSVLFFIWPLWVIARKSGTSECTNRARGGK